MEPNYSGFGNGNGGFGEGGQRFAFTHEQLDELNKALSAGDEVNNPGAVAGDGFPLRVQSLERVLKNVTFRMEHLRFFKAIPKIPAANTIEEHNVLSSYGEQDEGFVAEGELPESDDSTYERKIVRIKYIGTTRSVTHPMTLVKPAHGNVTANETVSGTMLILRILERALFFARNELSDLQFDGFEKLITDGAPAANIIDLRGQPLDEDVLIDGALTIGDAPNYGIPTHMHMNPKVKADLVKTFLPKGRYDIGAGTKGDSVGLDIRSFTSPYGEVMFEPNTFINDGGPAPAKAKGDSAKRPGTPTITTAATSPVDAAGLFGTDDAGTYTYKISAHNNKGGSIGVSIGGAVTVSAGDRVTFGVTPGGGGDTKWYQLYRSKVGGASGTERLIARIPNTALAGELTVDDFNEQLPYCSSVFIWQQNLECLGWKQLAPLLKIPLSTVDATIRWMLLLYGSPVLYAPGKTILIKNVGRSPAFVGGE